MGVAFSRLLGILAGLTVGALLLWTAFLHSDVRSVVELLRRGDWGLPALGVLVGSLLYVFFKVVRWRHLLGGAAGVPTVDLVHSTTAGLALNALLPHAGEFVRAASLQRRHGYVASAVLASIVAERVFDLLAVLLLCVCALPVLVVPVHLAAALKGIAVLAAGASLCILLLLFAPSPILSLVRSGSGVLPSRWARILNAEFEAAVQAVEPMRSPRTIGSVLFLSLLQWLAIAFCALCSALVVGSHVTLAAAVLVVAGIVVAFLLPNAPGYAGSVQLAFVMSLGATGIAPASALAASVVYQALMIGPVVIAGLVFLPSSLRRNPDP